MSEQLPVPSSGEHAGGGGWTSLPPRRGGRRLIAAVVVAVVAAGAVLAVTDPFKGSAPAAASYDNSYPTSTATITEQSLSSTTDVDATLGYAGSYEVAIPSGTPPSTITADEQALQSARSKLSDDESTLARAKSLESNQQAATLLAAEGAVSTDETALAAARAQLAADERLNCPAASSATVTTATGSGSPSSDGTSPGSSSPGSSTPGSSTPTGSTGSGHDPSLDVALLERARGAASRVLTGATGTGPTGTGPTGETGASPPSSTLAAESSTSSPPQGGNAAPATSSTGPSSPPSTSPAGATGSPGGSSPGGSGSATTTTPGGPSPGGSASSPATTTPGGSSPGGTGSGSATTTTTIPPPTAPTVTAAPAAAVGSSSVTLSGTVDPDGAVTEYRFEYGTSSSRDSFTPAVTLSAGQSAVDVTAELKGLKADTTYQFTLEATNALGTTVSPPQDFGTAESSCQQQRSVVASDAEAVSAAQDTLAADEAGAGSTVTSDEQQVGSDEQQVAAESEALAQAQSEATNPGSRFTRLPAVGARIARGQSAYWLDGRPVPLLYGSTTPYRAMYLGVPPGPDVEELQANLIALGFGAGLHADGVLGPATTRAVEAWQASLGVPATGVVSLGDIVVEPGAMRVLTVSPTLGESAQAGTPVLSASSTTREVTIDLDASEQGQVKVGDPVSITLPDNSTTPGVVSSVGTVATEPAGSGAGSTGEAPTITVQVTPTDPAATGGLDQAPVEVAITNQSVANALAVPVDALLALSGGGYALEEVTSGAHHLVPVSLGIFDDADGLVQVSGSGIARGQRIVVPNL